MSIDINLAITPTSPLPTKLLFLLLLLLAAVLAIYLTTTLLALTHRIGGIVSEELRKRNVHVAPARERRVVVGGVREMWGAEALQRLWNYTTFPSYRPGWFTINPAQAHEQIWSEVEALGRAHGLRSLSGGIAEGMGMGQSSSSSDGGTWFGLSAPSRRERGVDGTGGGQEGADGGKDGDGKADADRDVRHRWRRHGRFYGFVHGHR
ncbi:hypothetical protein DFH27DRAFT_527053 [Peziza echinospora]|nr:hypothetical protein DFH27DRAFT_527053 [Peziza echinospora]